MILRVPQILPLGIISLLLFLTPHSYAADDSLFDCRVTVDGVKFDLTSVAGEHTASQKRATPPTSTVDLLRFDLCAELKRQDDVDEADQDLTFSTGSSSSKYVTVISTGPEYPHPSNSTPIHQILSLTILCSDETSDPVFKSYDGSQVVVEWSNPAGCPVRDGEDNGDDKNGSPKDKFPQDDKTETAGSGISWFFLVLILAFAAYFGLGAYYNYSKYGATGADLIPHRDFWKEVPYMLSDVLLNAKTLSTFGERAFFGFSYGTENQKVFRASTTLGEVIHFTQKTQASPLVNGVSGALHESFNTEEEAQRIFAEAQRRGATKAVGGHKADNGFLGLSISTEKPSARPTSNTTPRRMAATPVLETQSSPSVAPSKIRSSISPAAHHTDVSPTRGVSSINSSSTRRQQLSASRIYVRTPTDLLSYPSDDEDPSAHMITLSKRFTENLTVGRQGSSRISSPVELGEPKAHFHAGVLPQSSSFSRPNMDGILSPLDSPKFFTTDDTQLVAVSQAECSTSFCASCSPESSKARHYGMTPKPPGVANNIPAQSPPITPLDPRSPLRKAAFISCQSPLNLVNLLSLTHSTLAFSMVNKGRPSPNSSVRETLDGRSLLLIS
ncbi:hypothetical protein H0H92_006969 [Tricholoma furcatifolium]|nr:hypothetical protein H0H92_006969 [Tricholoma furcatifolium]